ncbi:dTDP-4-dehydrorhamnose reductase [Vibrio coralliilyticus]|uniref:dTDP-4-dehydrorhamnose reductase n=1 Tax=Vibrio coralliilyticus TaxID=190893 RepID=UPI00148E185F|nr:dTDP-4-dehydrorhamnose reductase [Vibrio coralliilyticus]NOI30720.1 dTDP-4-dehydrorhamnose reductase [Vibrio coralliilyticus]NOI49733.1 dTDP-4-dehydrorhamnose reductase [Vibrio coralliilyticus]WFB48035.1 dTDP-4-dehydrorhamnose reductase [Vibrio coralliilyticus]
MRVLVTGSFGQVGHCLTEQLKAVTSEVKAIDRTVLDITDRNEVFRLVQEFKPTVIINAAAYTAVDKAEEEVDLSYAINRNGPKYLAEAAQSIGAAILHISTDYVFAGNKQGLYQEDDVTDPQSVYGASKLAGEQEVINSCEKHIILRTAWVFGEFGNNFVKTMIRLGKERDSLGIVGDQFGGPTYAGDIAAALINFAQKITEDASFEFGIYHFSGLPHVSWYEFAETIFSKAVKQGVIESAPKLVPLTTPEYPTPAKRPENSKLDTDKVCNVLGIEPSDWIAALDDLSAY